MSARGLRKMREGVVVSDKMDKSVIVEVSRTVLHPLYQKYVRKRTRFMAHDETNACKVGDRVRIWVLAAGPNVGSAFHVVGGQFDTVYLEGAYRLRPEDGSPKAGSRTGAGQGGSKLRRRRARPWLAPAKSR